MTAPTEPAEDEEFAYIRDWLGMPGTVAAAPPIWRDVDDLPDISGWGEGAAGGKRSGEPPIHPAIRSP